ncbi:MAG TPA: DUF2071 domain-containing protein [Gemmataceae bacterium]|jgi:hypothetical protein
MDEPPSGRPFLTARWSNLFLATYAVPDELLAPRLPPGLDLDRRGGSAFISLVAFDFRDTRVFGIPWPGYRDFPEVNLRFYVRRGDERGVVFVRELVPPRLVAWLARLLYNEPYGAMPMTSAVTDAGDAVTIEHRLIGRGRVHTIRATGAKPAERPDAESTEHFFKEHRWGYGRTRRGAALRYEVRHPVWDVYPVRDYDIDVGWADLYGPEWAALQGAQPVSTVLAVGSEVAVCPQGRI